MEETNNTKQTPNYIELGEDPHSVGNIFNELSEELGELQFDKSILEKEAEKKNPLLITYAISRYIFSFGIFLAILLSADIGIRSSEDASLITSLPVCAYLSYGIVDYENTECKTPLVISRDTIIEKEKLEKNIAVNLILLVPKFIQSLDIVNSPKVQFIQEHTGDMRISIQDAIDHFVEIKNRTNYRGEDIECKSISLDEKGKLSMACDVYGGSLIAPSGLETQTSRETALLFLERLGDSKSSFQILSYPKTLDISQFNSTDGFKAVFSTKTSLDLKLQYLPLNKM